MAARETRAFAIYQRKRVAEGETERECENELSREVQDAFTSEDPFNRSAYQEYRSSSE